MLVCQMTLPCATGDAMVPDDHGKEGWEDKAKEVQRVAGELTSPPAKREMYFLAALYDRLARHARERLVRMDTCRHSKQDC
jgi:hypothetical protein